MELIIDTQNLQDAGFNTYLTRAIPGPIREGISLGERTIDANSLVGGTIGSEGIIYLGSKQIKLDGKNRRIVISDGVNDRVIIGQI